jgi:hypothetical protein
MQKNPSAVCDARLSEVLSFGRLGETCLCAACTESDMLDECLGSEHCILFKHLLNLTDKMLVLIAHILSDTTFKNTNDFGRLLNLWNFVSAKLLLVENGLAFACSDR